MGRIVNRRNALLGWAVWTFMRQRAKAKVEATVDTERAPRRWARRVVSLLAAALAALGVVALWRKLRGGGGDEWVAPEPLDRESVGPEAATPLTAVEPDDDIPPAA